MIRIVSIMLAGLIVTGNLHAQSPEALLAFDKGNSSFREGKYSEAVDSYQSVLELGYESAALHYNLGTAYYRLDELGMAVLHFEKAQHLDPDIPELRHSLTLVRSRTVDQFSRVPDPFWKPAFERLLRIASPTRYFQIGFGFYLATALLIGLLIARFISGNWARRCLLLAAVVGSILLLLAFSLSVYSAGDVRYVLVGDNADVLTEPDELASQEVRIHEGVVFEYLGEVDNWLHIKLPNGVTGWVPNKDVVRI